MDLKSLVRTFRFTELQQRAERDPSAKRPPTIMFLGVAFLLIGVAFGFAFILSLADAPGSSGQPLSEPEGSPEPTNETSPTPTPQGDDPGSAEAPSDQPGARADP